MTIHAISTPVNGFKGIVGTICVEVQAAIVAVVDITNLHAQDIHVLAKPIIVRKTPTNTYSPLYMMQWNTK